MRVLLDYHLTRKYLWLVNLSKWEVGVVGSSLDIVCLSIIVVLERERQHLYKHRNERNV